MAIIVDNKETECPVCHIEFNLSGKFTKKLTTYQYNNEYLFLEDHICPFCKSTLALVIDDVENVTIFDQNHDEKEHKFGERETKLATKIDDLRTLIDDLEEELADDPTEQREETISAKIDKAKRQLETTEEQLEKLVDRWNEWEDKYSEKILSWQEKQMIAVEKGNKLPKPIAAMARRKDKTNKPNIPGPKPGGNTRPPGREGNYRVCHNCGKHYHVKSGDQCPFCTIKKVPTAPRPHVIAGAVFGIIFLLIFFAMATR